jgi:capsular exopolysaccharide synthesis family protein
MTLLRKQALWLVIAMMAGIAAGWLIYAGKTTAYASTAQVDIETHVVQNSTPVQPNLATEKQVATSGVVVVGTARSLGLKPADISKALKAGVSGTSNVLSITCTMPTVSMAERCAAAAAAAYIDFRNQSAESLVTQTHDPLHATLVTQASTPLSPAGLSKKILLPLGAIIGLLLGIGGIYVRDRLDDRVRDRADLERCLEVPVLATIPRLRRGEGKAASIFLQAPLSPAAEAYRRLRVGLQPHINSASDQGAVLLVASGRTREGRTSVAANLAAALAHAGTSVILVDADLRNPALGTVFEAAKRAGLADLLGGEASIEEVALPTDIPGLRLVTIGGLTSRSVDTFEINRINVVFAALKVKAEVVIVDSAPVSAISDAITLARVSDITLMVADVRRTDRAAATAAIGELRATAPRAIVGVLNNDRQPRWRRQTRPGVVTVAESPLPSTGVPARSTAQTPPGGQNGRQWIRLGALRRSEETILAHGTNTHDAPAGQDTE